MADKIVTVNKKASFRYFFLEKFEAGIVLMGSEVKSLRDGKISLSDSYAMVKDGEAFLINCHISQYPPANQFNHEPRRTRKLLLKRSEIDSLAGKIKRERLTVVPTRVYFKGGRAKVELALAKGKHLRDRREELKKKVQARETEQALKRKR